MKNQLLQTLMEEDDYVGIPSLVNKFQNVNMDAFLEIRSRLQKKQVETLTSKISFVSYVPASLIISPQDNYLLASWFVA